MRAYTERIREAAKRLLTEQRVDSIIGFRKGTVPFMNEPFIANTADQVDQLYYEGVREYVTYSLSSNISISK
jgi:hypothetical protein